MQRQRYTDEERARALELLAEHGQAEAARITGISPGTIGSWATRAGVSTDTGVTRAATEHRVATIAERKAALAETLVGVAERLAVDVFAPTVERKAVAAGAMREVEIVEIKHTTTTAAERRTTLVAIAQAVETIQLLTGGATQRIENIAERTPESEAEVARVLSIVRAA